MATTAGDSLYYPVGSDPIAPLNTQMATMQSSVQTAFNKRGMYSYRWNNSAGRTSQTGMRTGDTGYQADTFASYIFSAGGWQITTSGWVNLALGSGFSASSGTSVNQPAYRIYNGILFLRGYISRTTASATTVATLPAGYRPEGDVVWPMIGGNLAVYRLQVTAGGVITVPDTGSLFTFGSLSPVTYPAA